jgi:hypothetical protein
MVFDSLELTDVNDDVRKEKRGASPLLHVAF